MSVTTMVSVINKILLGEGRPRPEELFLPQLHGSGIGATIHVRVLQPSVWHAQHTYAHTHLHTHAHTHIRTWARLDMHMCNTHMHAVVRGRCARQEEMPGWNRCATEFKKVPKIAWQEEMLSWIAALAKASYSSMCNKVDGDTRLIAELARMHASMLARSLARSHSGLFV